MATPKAHNKPSKKLSRSSRENMIPENIKIMPVIIKAMYTFVSIKNSFVLIRKRLEKAKILTNLKIRIAGKASKGRIEINSMMWWRKKLFYLQQD